MSELPAGWRNTRLDSMADVKYGKAKPAGSGAIPVVGSSGVYATTASPLIEFPTLIVGRKGTAGKVWLQESPSWPSDTTFYLEWKQNAADLHFLYFAMVANPLSGDHARTTLPSLPRPDLEGFTLPLPPSPEQRTIVTTLRAVQEASDARRRELAAERERKAALMEDLFTGGVRGEAQKETEIGPLPQGWEAMRFDAVAEIAKGQVDPKQEPYKSMLHVGPENIESGTGRLSPLKTNGDLKVISGNYLFTAESVLYSKIRPYLNKAALPTFTGTCSADMYPLRPVSGKVTREYLFYYLLSEGFLRQVTASQDRTGIPKVNRDQLNAVIVASPPLDEQKDIAAALTACDGKIAALEAESALHDELFRALLEELLSGRVDTRPLIEDEKE